MINLKKLIVYEQVKLVKGTFYGAKIIKGGISLL